MVSVDLTNCKGVAQDALHKKFAEVNEKIMTPCGDNAWLNLPDTMGTDIEKIIKRAEWIRKHSDVMLVIGVGGSYLGAYAGLNFLADKVDFAIEFLGTSFDEAPINRFIKKYKGKRVVINVISKSGTTLEITSALETVIRAIRPVAVIKTSGDKDDFAVPKGVGGRYSVLSAVGLLPFAVAGLDVKAILNGGKIAKTSCAEEAYKYAVTRYLLHTKHKKDIEVITTFQNDIRAMLEWHQQLFCESEGKQGKGVFVAPMFFSQDLHSMGQHLQQGKPTFFETFVTNESDLKGNKLNNAAFGGTVKAHSDAGVPCILINLGKCDEETLGYLFYFFQIACVMSAHFLNVNPFDQPGVEEYKRNMRTLLEGK